MQKKERSERTGHEDGEDMKRKRKVCVCVFLCEGERMKGGTKWKGRKTTKPSLIEWT